MPKIQKIFEIDVTPEKFLNASSSSICPKCQGKGWYFVNEWIETLQGRKDCICNILTNT